MIIGTAGENDKRASIFDSDEKSGSQDALTRLVSQIRVKLIKLSEEGLQPDDLSKDQKKLLRQVVLQNYVNSNFLNDERPFLFPLNVVRRSFYFYFNC